MQAQTHALLLSHCDDGREISCRQKFTMAMLNILFIALKSQLQNPKTYLPVSFIHNPTSHNQGRSVYSPAIQFVLNEAHELQSSRAHRNHSLQKEGEEEILRHKQQGVLSSIQISHPWLEWVDLMEKLLKNGYFDETGSPFASNGQLGNKDANLIRTACLNFARDHYQLIRYLSQKDIMVIAESGCPSTDRKVVNSGKRLRAHLGMNEGNVCSSCILRGDCDRAYVKAREDEGGRTVDVMRFLLTYGLDPVVGSVVNTRSLNKKVKDSVRTLLKQMVEVKISGNEHEHEPPKGTAHDWSSSSQEIGDHLERSPIDVPVKEGDWICPKCNFHNFARNIKCLRCNGLFPERLKKLSEEQEHFPLKKGDWICDKCNFLNFARNTRCLQCKENPPKRQLNPGEWECESCNYINFRRNMACLKCDHRRPIASNPADIALQPVTNSVKNHPTQHWNAQEGLSRYKSDGSLQFVESECEVPIGSNSWNHAPGFKDFPVAGGKSDLSRNVQKHGSWKIEMTAKTRTPSRERKDSDRHNSYIFRGTGNPPSSGNDDEMAEWFGKGLGS